LNGETARINGNRESFVETYRVKVTMPCRIDRSSHFAVAVQKNSWQLPYPCRFVVHPVASVFDVCGFCGLLRSSAAPGLLVNASVSECRLNEPM